MKNSDPSPKADKLYSQLKLHHSDSFDTSCIEKRRSCMSQSQISLPQCSSLYQDQHSEKKMGRNLDNQEQKEHSIISQMSQGGYPITSSLILLAIYNNFCPQVLTNSGYKVNLRGDMYHPKLKNLQFPNQYKGQFSLILFFKFVNMIMKLGATQYLWVANYSVENQQLSRKQRSNNPEDYHFSFIMDKGNSSCKFLGDKNYSQNFVDLFWRKGKQEVYSWLSSIIQGVVQLMNNSIFNYDICFRNIIKSLDKKKETYTYKIIDFDISHDLSKANPENYFKNQAKQECAISRLIVFWMKQKNPYIANKIYHNFLFPSFSIEYVEKKVKDHLKKKVDYIQYCKNLKIRVQEIKNSDRQENEKVQLILKDLWNYSIFYNKIQILNIIIEALEKRSIKECPQEDFIQLLQCAEAIDTSSLKACRQSIQSLLVKLSLILDTNPLSFERYHSMEEIQIQKESNKGLTYSYTKKLALKHLQNDNQLIQLLSSLKQGIDNAVVPEEKILLNEKEAKKQVGTISTYQAIYEILFRHHLDSKNAFCSLKNCNIKPIFEFPKSSKIIEFPFEKNREVSNSMLESYLHHLLEKMISIEQIVLSYDPKSQHYNLNSSSKFNDQIGKSFFNMAFKDCLQTFDEAHLKNPWDRVQLKNNPSYQTFQRFFGQAHAIMQPLNDIVNDLSRTVFIPDILNRLQYFVLCHHRQLLKSIYQNLLSNCIVTPEATFMLWQELKSVCNSEQQRNKRTFERRQSLKKWVTTLDKSK